MSDVDERLAWQALGGHPDDVRTVIAWLVAVNGRIEQINDLTEARLLEHHVELARLWDGLDNAELVAKLKAAFYQLTLHKEALEKKR